jgi:hypothetical protein
MVSPEACILAMLNERCEAGKATASNPEVHLRDRSTLTSRRSPRSAERAAICVDFARMVFCKKEEWKRESLHILN